MQLAATSIYITLAAATLIALSVRVIRMRRRFGVGLGDSGREELTRAIRAQANFTEYVPFALILLMAIEQTVSHTWIVHLLGLALIAGRWAHAIGLQAEPRSYRGRVAGMALTFAAIGTGAIVLAVKTLSWDRGVL